MTNHEALDLFVLDRQAQNASPRTLFNYRNGIETILEEPAQEVSTVTANQIRERLLALEVNPSTAQTYLRYVKVFFGYLVNVGILQSDPTETVKPPKATLKTLDAMTENEYQRILASDLSDRERALFMVLLDTGMRISECASLKRGQFDRAGNAVILGKGNKQRAVKVGAKTLAAVRRHERQIVGPDLWPGREGKLEVRMLQHIIGQIGERVGVKLNAHKIRRTTAIMMLRNGCDVYSLASVLGHSDITVLKKYLPLVSADAQAAYERYGVL